MSIVTISIHKHECAICGCLFTRRDGTPTGQEGCVCSALEYVEFCPTCQAEIDAAEWLGKLVGRLVEKHQPLAQRVEALYVRQPQEPTS